jgi:hypothetical protein
MHISHVEIQNFRALQSVSVPLSTFSVLLGENDVGKTSFLHALDKYFAGKKLSDPIDWFKSDSSKDIRIVLTFQNVPGDEMSNLCRSDGSIVVSKVFPFDKPPQIKAVLDDGSTADVPKPTLSKWFSSERFHFIPVRRDLAVQFSMAKTALLGKTLRAGMKERLSDGSAATSLSDLERILVESIATPRATLETFLRQQMHNDAIRLGFDELEIDPVEGVSFMVRLSDDRVESVNIENRGAGTQNNLIIALFRLIAGLTTEGYFILAMEEPENSLHPKAQRQLLSVIQEISAKSQVIVTTHSPVFIDRSRFENNILMTRTTNGNTVAKTFDVSLLDQVRTDLGIRASDALLKGGGNCAILVEGRTEEDGFPTFMEMCGLSEFRLGIAIINMDGSDFQKARTIAQLLHAYDIPCVIVLDRNASKAADDLRRLAQASLPNIKEVFCLAKGNIEDYFPLEIVAEVINSELSPTRKLSASDFDSSKSAEQRLNNFKEVMISSGSGDSIRYLKTQLGGLGARLMKQRSIPLDPELMQIFTKVKQIADQG